MDDYLKSGQINPKLEYLNHRSTDPLRRKEELYLTGYGRQWGEKLTYSTGVAYGSGMTLGGTYGLVLGLSKGGATKRLLMNSILNSCSTHGPSLANKCAAITMFYCGFNNLISFINKENESLNATIAGALAGGLFKIAGSWRAIGTYSSASAVAFTAVSFASKHGYI